MPRLDADRLHPIWGVAMFTPKLHKQGRDKVAGSAVITDLLSWAAQVVVRLHSSQGCTDQVTSGLPECCWLNAR